MIIGAAFTKSACRRQGLINVMGFCTLLLLYTINLTYLGNSKTISEELYSVDFSDLFG